MALLGGGFGALTLAGMVQKEGQSRRRHAIEPSRLSQSGRASCGQLLAHFRCHALQCQIINIIGQAQSLIAPESFNISCLTINIAGIKRVGLNLQAHVEGQLQAQVDTLSGRAAASAKGAKSELEVAREHLRRLKAENAALRAQVDELASALQTTEASIGARLDQLEGLLVKAFPALRESAGTAGS